MLDLNGIKKRAEKALSHKISMFPNEVILIERDIPALLAHIDKLTNKLNGKQWISVNDNLPHKDQLVLVANGHWLNLKTFCIDDDGEKYWFDYIVGEKSEIEEYTHWMQLPLTPKEATTHETP